MYRSHWGLNGSPFPGCLDPSLFYQSSAHEEALARLHFLVEQQRRLGMLVGPPGCGKSMLLEVFAGKLDRKEFHVARVNLLGMDDHEWIWTLASQMGMNPSVDAPGFRIWRMVSDRLTENRYQEIGTVVLLDDADDAESETLTQIVRLVHLGTLPGSALTIILTADSDRTDLVGARLIELAELRIELEPWNESETTEYVKHSFARAGRKTPVFGPSALVRLHQLTGGIPRKVNQLAELSLLAGAGAEMNEIDPPTIDAVYQELGVHQQPMPA